MRRLSYCLIVIGTLSFAVLPAHGQGVLFLQKETRGGQTTNTQIQMDKDHIRVESRSSGDESAFVFDGPKQVARMINITKKTYTEMSKSDLDQTRNQMNSAMAQMEAQMRGLPPDQRAMMEAMMRGRGMPGMAAAPPKVEYRQDRHRQGRSMDLHQIRRQCGRQKTTELCAVDPKEFRTHARRL
jgi:hypothetical protein